VGWVSEAKATIAALQENKAKMEQDVATAIRDKNQAKVDFERVLDANKNLERRFCGLSNYNEIVDKLFQPHEARQLKTTHKELLARVVEKVDYWHDQYQHEVGGAFEKGKQLAKAQRMIEALHKRMDSRRVPYWDIEAE
jgi:uncharacterized protein (DUF3084 family)